MSRCNADPKAATEASRSQAEAVINSTKNYHADLQKLGTRIKYHEDKIRSLRSQIYSSDNSIIDLQVHIGKYQTSIKPVAGKEDAAGEKETYEHILKKANTAAGLVCQLHTRHGTQAMKDVVGVVATLGKVEDANLSRLLAEYLGEKTMLALVCKTVDGVKAMESCDKEGVINRNFGVHGHASAIGRAIDGRFIVICLDHLRPYGGQYIADDPQRRLDLPKPKLPGGGITCGFIGYAVNLIHINTANLSGVTTSGNGLRETLFYHLFSHLQVYRTREDMLQALPYISDGAVSLDGGTIRSPGVFCLGDREEAEVKFPSMSGLSNIPANCFEIEETLKMEKWKQERLLEDLGREQLVLDQEMFNFKIKKEEFLQFLARNS